MVAFAYNHKIFASTEHNLLFLNYRYYPREEISSHAVKQLSAVKKYSKKLADAQLKAMGLLQKVQSVQAIQYNCKKHKIPLMKKGNLVWLL